jgi:hypothetical protein
MWMGPLSQLTDLPGSSTVQASTSTVLRVPGTRVHKNHVSYIRPHLYVLVVPLGLHGYRGHYSSVLMTTCVGTIVVY